MINIKKFIDRVSALDRSANNDLVMSRNEARILRDEIVKLLLDKLQESGKKNTEISEVKISGGRW